MKSSLIILSCFALGVIAGRFGLLPAAFLEDDWSLVALYALVFLVGVGVGTDRSAWDVVRELRFRVFLIPASVVVGTAAGVSVCAALLPGLSLADSLAVGAGFGYYSLSSIIIAKAGLTALSVVALLANLSREILTLVLTPVLSRYVGKLAPIASGGATAMDTTLPIITEFSGKQYAMISVASGTLLTVLVPLLVKAVLLAFF
jgi:uncharacterized membrane protein YbjE (DUF340 family)